MCHQGMAKQNLQWKQTHFEKYSLHVLYIQSSFSCSPQLNEGLVCFVSFVALFFFPVHLSQLLLLTLAMRFGCELQPKCLCCNSDNEYDFIHLIHDKTKRCSRAKPSKRKKLFLTHYVVLLVDICTELTENVFLHKKYVAVVSRTHGFALECPPPSSRHQLSQPSTLFSICYIREKNPF